MKVELVAIFPILNTEEKMPATLHVTPPPDNRIPYSGHILWAPKKKQSYRKRNFIPAENRVHSKCRKRLEFSHVADFVEPSQQGSSTTAKEKKNSESQASVHVPATPNLKCQETVEQDNLKFLRPSSKQGTARGSHTQTAKRKLNLSTFR